MKQLNLPQVRKSTIPANEEPTRAKTKMIDLNIFQLVWLIVIRLMNS